MNEQTMKGEMVAMWSCSTCGPHPASRGGWCEHGCGSDYNRMERIEVAPEVAHAMQTLIDRAAYWRKQRYVADRRAADPRP